MQLSQAHVKPYIPDQRPKIADKTGYVGKFSKYISVTPKLYGDSLGVGNDGERTRTKEEQEEKQGTAEQLTK